MEIKFFEKIDNMQDLKTEYRKLAMENHPDKNGCEETMTSINLSFEDAKKRIFQSDIFKDLRGIISDDDISRLEEMVDKFDMNVDTVISGFSASILEQKKKREESERAEIFKRYNDELELEIASTRERQTEQMEEFKMKQREELSNVEEKFRTEFFKFERFNYEDVITSKGDSSKRKSSGKRFKWTIHKDGIKKTFTEISVDCYYAAGRTPPEGLGVNFQHSMRHLKDSGHVKVDNWREDYEETARQLSILLNARITITRNP